MLLTDRVLECSTDRVLERSLDVEVERVSHNLSVAEDVVDDHASPGHHVLPNGEPDEERRTSRIARKPTVSNGESSCSDELQHHMSTP